MDGGLKRSDGQTVRWSDRRAASVPRKISTSKKEAGMEDRSPRWRSRPPKGPRRGYGRADEPFIGGAELARRNARKRQRMNGGGFGPNQNRTLANTCNASSCTVARIPKSAKPSERFFASLFRSSVEEFKRSDDNDTSRREIMSNICGRAGLPMPAKIQAASIDANHFYSTRAALVMEEARFVIADALRRHTGPADAHGRRHVGPTCLSLQLVSVEEREKLGGCTVLTFEKRTPGATFASQELYDMRPGCCFEIITAGRVESNRSPDMSSSILANVVPSSDRSNIERQLTLMVYHKLGIPAEACEDMWEVRPLTTLISEQRQFEACGCSRPKVPFLHKLLGWKSPSHVRFGDSDSSSDEDGGEEKKCDIEEHPSHSHGLSPQIASGLLLNPLNPTQERAASEYLSSPSGSVTLVQGPPGSGKTTFTVSCILRCLFQSSEEEMGRRILVTAPTNKAITVLASRFLAALDGDASFNVVLIGVEDKLVDDDDSLQRSVSSQTDNLRVPSSFRDIFVYTWLDTMSSTFQAILEEILAKQTTKSILSRLRGIRKKLRKGIPSLYRESGAPQYLDCLIGRLEQSLYDPDEAPSSSEIEDLFENITSSLQDIDQSGATQELLATADVIFCTLSTAGISAMKHTPNVTDLFVDEAAAATEAEICIPFHTRPNRMLVVGDPMQLPATIMSRHASDLGLGKSLHERLMYDCGKEHVMLDLQYRMRPEICTFPSRSFYEGKLMNGDNVVKESYGSHSTTLFDGKPVVFLQSSGSERKASSGSYCNKEEGQVVVDIVKALRAKSSDDNSTNWSSSDKIRIITFYQAQVVLIQQMLRQSGLSGVLVGTVDACQGCEADVCILSFVRSNQGRCGNIKHSVGFLCDDRRLNVALTRARYQLICIGNVLGTLSSAKDTTLADLAAEARERGCIISSLA